MSIDDLAIADVVGSDELLLFDPTLEVFRLVASIESAPVEWCATEPTHPSSEHVIKPRLASELRIRSFNEEVDVLLELGDGDACGKGLKSDGDEEREGELTGGEVE